MKIVFSFLTLLLFLPKVSIGNSQSGKPEFYLLNRLFTLTNPYGTYHCLQGQYSRQFSSNFYGVQFKKLTTDGEIGFSGISAKGLSLAYGKIEQREYLNFDANYHLGLIPLTLIFCLGVGGSLTTDLQGYHFISFYPSLFFDIGGIEVSYHYKFRVANSIPGDFSGHTFKLNLGLGINRKERFANEF